MDSRYEIPRGPVVAGGIAQNCLGLAKKFLIWRDASTVAPTAMQIPARASRPDIILLDACQGARGMRLVIDQVIRTMQPAGQAYFEDVSPIGLFGERQNPRFYLPGRHYDLGRPF
jgi:hypothetical protein